MTVTEAVGWTRADWLRARTWIINVLSSVFGCVSDMTCKCQIMISFFSFRFACMLFQFQTGWIQVSVVSFVRKFVEHRLRLRRADTPTHLLCIWSTKSTHTSSMTEHKIRIKEPHRRNRVRPDASILHLPSRKLLFTSAKPIFEFLPKFTLLMGSRACNVHYILALCVMDTWYRQRM